MNEFRQAKIATILMLYVAFLGLKLKIKLLNKQEKIIVKNNIMTEQEILEGNKLIAEFMGVEIVKRNNEDAVFMFENAAFPEYFRCTKHNTYSSDWNLLMPVLEKIESLEYNVNINGLACHIEKPNGEIICYSKQFEDKKATCYSAVNSFVRWYKTQAVSIK